MQEKQLILNDGATALNSDMFSTNILDMEALTDTFGDAVTQKIFSDGGFLNITCPTAGVGATTNTVAVQLRTSETNAALTSDYTSCSLIAAQTGASYAAGSIQYSAPVPIPLKRYVGLYFDETGTTTTYMDAWIGAPITNN